MGDETASVHPVLEQVLGPSAKEREWLASASTKVAKKNEPIKVPDVLGVDPASPCSNVLSVQDCYCEGKRTYLHLARSLADTLYDLGNGTASFYSNIFWNEIDDASVRVYPEGDTSHEVTITGRALSAATMTIYVAARETAVGIVSNAIKGPVDIYNGIANTVHQDK